MTDLIEDLKTLTTIPRSALEQLQDKSESIICHALFESRQNREPVTEIDLGIGYLNILNEEDCIKYKFIPSSRLEKKLIESTKSDYSPLVTEVESELKAKVMNVYKNLF